MDIRRHPPAAQDRPLTILGLETSCDETAAALLRLHPGGRGEILCDRIYSQISEHAPFGGVVPEIAARKHVEILDGLIVDALREADLGFGDLDAVAATAGPGLVGGVMVGLMAGKGIALAHDLPFLAVNHLEGHALSPKLASDLAFPYLLLLVSGGHTQLLSVEGVGDYTRLGSTIDDAAGEAFDKCAKMLGLGYPGGPAVEAAARRGDAARFSLPRPLWRKIGCDFSFAGLKGAVHRVWHGLDTPTPKDAADLAASFQAALGDVLVDRTTNALKLFKARHGPRTFVVAGGVAANAVLRARLEALAAEHGFAFTAPPPHLCTDNAAMIAYAGGLKWRAHGADGLDAPARPRWPLDEAAASMHPASGSGKKGPKS